MRMEVVMTTATLLRQGELQRETKRPARQEITAAPIGEGSLANRPDLIAELARHLSAAGMLGRRPRRGLWMRIKSFAAVLS
jgi:hypothetical protein